MATETYFIPPPDILSNLQLIVNSVSPGHNFTDRNCFDVFESDQQSIANLVTNGASIHRKPSGEKALLDDSDDEDYSYDCEGWKKKPIVLWNENDTKSWLSDASMRIGQLYDEISPKLAMPGENLLLLTVEDWLRYDDKFGKQLYDLLCVLKDPLNGSLIIDLDLPIEDLDIDTFINGITQPEGDFSPLDSDAEPPGGPVESSSEDDEPNERKTLVHLFVISLLDNPENHFSIIRWENYEERIFQFKDTKMVAKLWGEFGNNKFKNYKKPMTFDTFSKALRQNYRTGIKSGTGTPVFVSHPDKTFYKLGPGAKGYRNADRKFEHYDRFESLIKRHNLPFLQSRGS